MKQMVDLGCGEGKLLEHLVRSQDCPSLAHMVSTCTSSCCALQHSAAGSWIACHHTVTQTKITCQLHVGINGTVVQACVQKLKVGSDRGATASHGDATAWSQAHVLKQAGHVAEPAVGSTSSPHSMMLMGGCCC